MSSKLSDTVPHLIAQVEQVFNTCGVSIDTSLGLVSPQKSSSPTRCAPKISSIARDGQDNI